MKLVATEFVSLDGVMEAPEKWSGPFFDEGVGKFKLDEVMSTDALLLGRVTYEGFAAAWPEREDEDGFADRFNSIPKHVVTTTLNNLEWNNSRTIEGDVYEGIAALKKEDGQDIVIHGSGRLVNSLLERGLIDEYRLMVFPILVGKGKKLFAEGTTADMKLVDSKTFDSGVTVQTYEPAPAR